MTTQNSSTYPKTKTEQIQEYLERDLPRSVLIAAYRSGRHESIVKHVKEHYGRSTISYQAIGDFIGIEIVVRDAITNIGLKTSPYKELRALPSVSELTERYGEAAAFAINEERVNWMKLIERLGVSDRDFEHVVTTEREESSLRLPLAVSQSRDGKIKVPHRVLIDHGDFPVAVVYGDNDSDAELKSQLFVKRINTHELLVHELQAVRNLMPDVMDALTLAGSEAK